MLPKIFWIVAGLCLVSAAQENATQQPQVKVNVLNVCTPSAEEQQEISSALSHVPKRPSFSEDFEVDRGRSVLDQGASPLPGMSGAETGQNSTADFVRIRRDVSGNGAYSTVQYSFSRDTKQMIETLVFRVRDPKDLLQVSIEDTASSVTTPATMLGSETPAGRIKLERFGKSSIVLARCSGTAESPAPDQSAYQPLFASASSVLSDYRRLLNAKILVPDELARIRRAAVPPAATPGKQNKAR